MAGPEKQAIPDITSVPKCHNNIFWVIPFLRNFGYYLRMNTEVTASAEASIELRAAVRFPLCIPISVSTEVGEVGAMTVNISANGVLFELSRPLQVGSSVSFTIPMPGEAMGTPADVVANCTGRVVRCTQSEDGWQAAAVIDKYYFSH